MATSKPVIVFLPGAFSRPSDFDLVSDPLREVGYEVHVVHHPSSPDVLVQPTPSMYDDADNIHRLVESLADEGKNIVIVMHSYGGLPGTQACEGLSRTERLRASKPGGIVRLLYVGAAIAPVGSSMAGILRTTMPLPSIETANGSPSWWTSVSLAVGGFIPLSWTAWLFSQSSLAASVEGLWAYNRNPDIFTNWLLTDIPREEALRYASGSSPVAQSVKSTVTPLTYAGYKHIPCSYMITKLDRVNSPEVQRGFINLVEKESGTRVDVHECEVGHCPQLSRPLLEVECVRRVAGEKV
ncbi:Alpha/beta hydrolase fold-1 [Diaporthe sp. PMI_573]|nr:Alpha/beta hydrolase fold-1 [Diaporthaceae sp. PMI_573]